MGHSRHRKYKKVSGPEKASGPETRPKRKFNSAGRKSRVKKIRMLETDEKLEIESGQMTDQNEKLEMESGQTVVFLSLGLAYITICLV